MHWLSFLFPKLHCYRQLLRECKNPHKNQSPPNVSELCKFNFWLSYSQLTFDRDEQNVYLKKYIKLRFWLYDKTLASLVQPFDPKWYYVKTMFFVALRNKRCYARPLYGSINSRLLNSFIFLKAGVGHPWPTLVKRTLTTTQLATL
jgi:hypothetical protein